MQKNKKIQTKYTREKISHNTQLTLAISSNKVIP